MAFWKKKEETPKKPVGVKYVERTTFGGNGITIATDPVKYKPDYKFSPYFKASATLFYIPQIVHRIIQENPIIYPLDMSEPFRPGIKAKPISYSIDLINAFKRKENTPDKGRLYFGKVQAVYDRELNETRRNDLSLNILLRQYITDFITKFNKDPTELDGMDAFNYPDPKDKTKIRGINDVSKEQFTLFALNDAIGIADGRTIKNKAGYLENKSSTNGTSINDISGELKDISLGKSQLEIVALAPRSEFAQPAFNYTYATFGHEILTLGQDHYSAIKGGSFIMLVTSKPLLKNIEDLKEEFAFKHAR